LGYELYEGENWNGEYQSSVFNYLRSPAIDCSNLTGVGLQFQRILNLRTNDVGRVLVNDQVVWETPRRGFSESEWTQERIDISDLADGQSKVVVSFDLRSNNTTNLGGWNIDDFILAGNLFSSSAAVTDVLPTDALGEAFPNPFVDRVEIPFSISRNAWVEIAIFDHFGRIVKTLINKRMPAGQHQLSWDGTNEGGEKLAQGLYYCQFKTDGFQETQRLLFFM
jgi:hypothetical protein